MLVKPPFVSFCSHIQGHIEETDIACSAAVYLWSLDSVDIFELDDLQTRNSSMTCYTILFDLIPIILPCTE